MYLLLKILWYSPQGRSYVSYKISFSVFKWATTIQSILYNKNGIKPGKNTGKEFGKFTIFGNLTILFKITSGPKQGALVKIRMCSEYLLYLNYYLQLDQC